MYISSRKSKRTKLKQKGINIGRNPEIMSIKSIEKNKKRVEGGQRELPYQKEKSYRHHNEHTIV